MRVGPFIIPTRNDTEGKPAERAGFRWRRGGQPDQLPAAEPLVRARRSKCSRPWPVAPPLDSAPRPGRPLSLVGALGSCGEPTR